MSPQDCHAASFCTQRSRAAAAIRTYHARHTLRTAAVKRLYGGRGTYHATAAVHIVSRPTHGEENGVRVGQKRKNRKVIISLRPCDKAVYSDWESNPDQRFRKPTFYPLNYQSPF